MKFFKKGCQKQLILIVEGMKKKNGKLKEWLHNFDFKIYMYNNLCFCF